MAALRREYARRNRRILRRIQLASRPPQHPQSDFVDPSVLACLPIRLSSLPDCDDQIDFELRFSRLYDSEHFEELFRKTIGPPGKEKPRNLLTTEHDFTADEWVRFVGRVLDSRELLDTDWFDPQTKRLLDHSQWLRAPALAGGGRSEFFERQGRRMSSWYTYGVFATSKKSSPTNDDSCDGELPHVSCLLEDEAVMDDRATRSEILCAAHFILQRLRYRAWNGHSVHPVCKSAYLRCLSEDLTAFRSSSTDSIKLPQKSRKPTLTAPTFSYDNHAQSLL